MNSDGVRLLQLSKQRNVFGGGRFNFLNDTCELSKDEFIQELINAQKASHAKITAKTKPIKEEIKEDKSVKQTIKEDTKITEEVPPGETITDKEEVIEEPKRKARKRKSSTKEAVEEAKAEEKEETLDEKPKRTRRSRRKKTE